MMSQGWLRALALMRTNTSRAGCAIMWTGLLTYLLVGSSRDFAAFAPVVVPTRLFYVALFVAGLTVGYLSDGVGPGVLTLGLVLLVPVVIYGFALALLPMQLSAPVMARLFSVWAIQRSLAYLMYEALFGGFGLVAGLYASEFYSH